jgi:hypothetical protein
MKSAITTLLKDLRFRYDLFLPFSKGEYIPIQWIFEDVDCDDEAILCREFRTNFPEIQISEDGQQWRVHLDTLEIDKRTVYVEGSWEIVNSQLNLSLIEDVWHHRHGMYHFITFRKESYAKNCIQANDVVPSPKSVGRSLRWLHKPVWNKRMEQYHQLRLDQVALHDEQKRNKISTHTLSYLPGLIGCFANVHDRTDTKSLKNLFEMVSPVSYIDYEQGNTWGYVRFKTKRGAQLAQNYFTRCCVTQLYPADSTGSLDPHRSVRHFRFLMRNQDTFADAITMYVLEGDEEKAYWDKIFAAQNAQECTIVESNPSTHIKFDDNEERHTEMNSSTSQERGHVRFESDDDESLEMEMVPLQQPTDYPARKPRHRKRRKLLQE